MKTFLLYLARFVYAPRTSIHALKADPDAVKYGVWAVLLISVLYSLTSLGLHFFGYRQCCYAEPLIKVPEASFWLIQTSWEIPLMFTFAILPAGIADLLTYRRGRSSQFLLLFAAMGFIAFTVQFPNMWLPETAGLLVGRDFLPASVNFIRQAIFVPWWLGLASLAVAIIAETSWLRGFLVSFVSFLPLPPLVALLIR